MPKPKIGLDDPSTRAAFMQTCRMLNNGVLSNEIVFNHGTSLSSSQAVNIMSELWERNITIRELFIDLNTPRSRDKEEALAIPASNKPPKKSKRKPKKKSK